MSEQVFLQREDIVVTSTRVIARGETYALSSIVSVRKIRNDPTGCLALIFIFVFGLLFTGGIVSIIAIFMAFDNKLTFSVELNTASGQTSIFSSENEQVIDEIERAVN